MTTTPVKPGGFVLNVNDDPAARYLVSRILQKAGFEVHEASGGLEALALARQRPQLVVLDVHLPDIDGLEVCRRLKADPLTAGIPVLQTSAAFVSTERRVLGLESGADGYLTQPIEPPELVATVRALLRADSAESRLRDTAVEWQRTFDALHEAVMIVDRGGRVLRGNQALQLLTGGNAVADRTLAGLFDQAAVTAQLELVEQAGASELRQTGEIAIGGRWFTVTVDPMPKDEQAAAPERFVIVLTDITATRRLAEEERRQATELNEANQRKDRFLAMLAHELRNPLNAIASANALGERIGPQDEPNARMRGIIARQTRHLARLVEDLLEASRFTRGRIALQRQRLSLLDVLEAAVQANSSLADSRSQRVVLTKSECAATVDGDPLRLEQIFGNVIQNALKYSEPGTSVAVGCEVTEGQVVVRIRDEGIGIPPEHLRTIFELFAQVDESLARSVGGLGIGLTLARALVEMHGGTIEAFSAGLGKGTEVVVRLPQVEAAVVPDTAITAPVAQRPLTILVVEDNDDAAELLATLLGMWNHRVHRARDGISGLEVATTVCPDVALVDIGLPGIDGYQVAQNLRAAPATSGCYLVAITGYGRPEDRARALAAGFDRYLIKPINFEALEEALAAAGAVVAARQ